jgi:hypothetical protein
MYTVVDTSAQAAQLREWSEVIAGFIGEFRASAEQHRAAVERGLPPEELAWLEKEANAWQRHLDLVARRLDELATASS